MTLTIPINLNTCIILKWLNLKFASCLLERNIYGLYVHCTMPFIYNCSYYQFGPPGKSIKIPF